MKKWVRHTFIVTTAALLISTLQIIYAESVPTKLIVKDKVITEDLPTIMDSDRTLIPLRIVSEALDAQVMWDVNTSTATVQIWGERLNLKPNAQHAQLQGGSNNDEILELESPAKLKKGTLYVPLRLIAQSFGYKVSWVPGEISINSPLSEEQEDVLYRGSLEEARWEIIRLFQPVHYMNTPLNVTNINGNYENYDNTYIFPEGEVLSYYHLDGDTISWIELKDDFLVCTWQAHFKDLNYDHLDSFLQMNIKDDTGETPHLNKEMLYYSQGYFGDSSHEQYGQIDGNGNYTLIAYEHIVGGSVTNSEGTMTLTLPGEVRTDYKYDY
ncbi:copper amine oxidase N-terminal domain-containing protein [Chengkuizengella axinellae]|uniref:Copper amine oxidase N-terminal domain-containing protein n=1 Tax=Chengkuizengella axinellae TaxID=3064388 RepID=A0ABT9IXY5_9BACL|nr:copper amine oxidase N-terminal domain-containing protein [Chengkuizengella sp. 2205SS18-9]MDP5274222.1 copper amine oxidase N-terminal domain-containing protein [Chengkuizengella sp. 2205SS18-9]